MLTFLTLFILLITISIISFRQYQTKQDLAIIFNQLSELNKKISACDDSIYGIQKVSLRSLEDGLRSLNIKIIGVINNLEKINVVEATIEEE